MKRLNYLLIVSLLLLSTTIATAQVEVVNSIPTTSRNTNYPSNEAPLMAQKLIKLPTGSIAPQGWLKTILTLQRDGLNGHLEEVSQWLQKDNNAWLKSGGEYGWEEVPYWLRGYSDLAFVLHDKQMFANAKSWIDTILKSQHEDGNFGPLILRNGIQDYWPNMLALWIMQNYYEYTGDKRVIDFMTKYFHYELSVPDNKFLEDYWENSRGGDNLWSVVWLYNRTKDKDLLTLADKIHRNTANWTKSSELPNWHNVNVAECFREPATYYLFNGREDMLDASYNVQSFIRRTFGQVPGGMFGADENARIGFFDPRQGTETCGFAEQMASDEIMLLITADQMWANNCEDVAFNSMPAALMPDMKALRYLTMPNMVASDSKTHNPGINNGGPMLTMNPFSSRCCQHNHGFAWPYYNDFLIFATPDNGLAAVMFNSCEAKAKVADGKEVTLTETTDYPFDGNISFNINTKKDVEFPLYIRIPSWTSDATAEVNGEKIAAILTPNQYLRINRKWHNGDKITVNLPMKLSMRTWQVNKNSVSVDYGPLTLSLKIKERYNSVDTKKTIIGDSKYQNNVDVSKWPSYEILPESAWNYALDTSAPIELVKKDKVQEGTNPFSLSTVPLTFKAKGRIVPSWKIDEYGLCGILPYENAKKSDSEDVIELVPMGAARLRISAFPTCK